MKYIAEFDLRSQNTNQISEVIRQALLAAFDSVGNINLKSGRTYIGELRPGKPIEWKEIVSK